MKLCCIRLLVKDFDTCFDFYQNKLGLTASWGALGDNYASFDIGIPSGLSIYKSDLMAEAIGNLEIELPINKREKQAIILQVDDVDKSFEELSGMGIKFINVPRDMAGWGMRVAHLRDPEDNLIELWCELSKEKWDDGLLADAKKYND